MTGVAHLRPADEDLPAQDQHAEQCVLGAMMLDRQAIADVREVLQPRDFYRPAHSDVFACISDLHAAGEPADAVTVGGELRRRGALDRVGGAPYLHTVISVVPTATNAGYYAEIVAEMAKRRRAAEVLTRAQQLIRTAAPDRVDEILGQAATELTETGARPDAAANSWAPVDLGPYLAGTVQRPVTSVGMVRTDGLALLYPGLEHSVIGEMESGKSWLCLASVAAELFAGEHVLYVHFEESDPMGSIERLRSLGVSSSVISTRFRFVGPDRGVTALDLQRLLDPAPSLVVLDGVNEAMAMHGWEIREEDGAAAFRRHLVKPCTRAGAAVLSADHVVKDAERRGRYGIGSVHKGNGLSGTLILLENADPFGRTRRGRSHVFVTKDRPGNLRQHGRPDRHVNGKFYLGELVVDDTQQQGPDLSLRFHAPAEPDAASGDGDSGQVMAIADVVLDVLRELPDQTAPSKRLLLAAIRKAGHAFRDVDVVTAVDDLEIGQQIEVVKGRRGATGYRVATASQGGESSAAR